MEYSPTREELLLLDSQLLHCVAVKDIYVAAAIYQNSQKTRGPCVHGKGDVQDQGVGARTRHHLWVISPAPADRLLGPMHEFWNT